MRFRGSLVGLLVAVGATAAGCHRGIGDVHEAWGPMQGRLAYNLPPAERLMEPGPGVGGPGPGVIPPMDPNLGGVMGDGSVMQAGFAGGGFGGPGGPGGPGCGCGPGPCGPGPCGPGGAGLGTYAIGSSQVAFYGEDGIMINWDVSCPGAFDSSTLMVPGRQDFQQGAIYRLRVSNVPGRDGVELFPSLEVAPVTPRTDAFLAHAPIPVQFTEEDFDQVLGGNFVTKVIYLPDPEFQELALANIETLVSTRLPPGVDPIAEADRRGSILAIIRMGNKDLRGMARRYYGPGGPSGPNGVICAAYESQGGPMGGPMNGPMEGEMYPAEGGYEGSYDGGYDGGYDASGSCNCGPNGCADGSCGYGPGCGGPGYGGPSYGGGGYGGGGVEGMPMGMPTAGFAPAPVPPHMIAGGPTWGMPITGTPIGLPGPPHIPLGNGAGLQRHVMKNRTRVVMPAPVEQFNISVKQRPGMNYPRPVNSVHVDEVHREPGGLFPGLSAIWGGAHANAGLESQGGRPVNGQDCYQ